MKWLKDNWIKVLLIILAAALVYGFITCKGLSQDYKDLKAKAEADSRESARIQKEAEARIAELESSRAEDKEIIEAAEKEIAKIREEKGEISKAYAVEKAKVKELADDKLAIAINNRIGEGQAKLLQMGVFSLKREGAENSLKLFIQGEECQNLREKDLVELGENQKEIEALMNTNNAWSLQDEERIKTIDALKIEVKSWKDANNQLESDFKKSRLTQFLKGTAAGVGLVLLIRLVAGI